MAPPETWPVLIYPTFTLVIRFGILNNLDTSAPKGHTKPRVAILLLSQLRDKYNFTVNEMLVLVLPEIISVPSFICRAYLLQEYCSKSNCFGNSRILLESRHLSAMNCDASYACDAEESSCNQNEIRIYVMEQWNASLRDRRDERMQVFGIIKHQKR